MAAFKGNKEYFPGIDQIKYEGPDSKNPMAFKWYDPKQVVLGKPMKHQYDFDTATVVGFLKAHGLDKDFKMNIEVNHATLAGHTFAHELRVARDTGMFGSIDANKGDYQNGWDTDEFPTNIYEVTEAMIEIILNGGFTTGGINFDAKRRRNSTDLEDMFIAHAVSYTHLTLPTNREV